ncbi:MAG TPA: hypothetical protein PKA33_06265 [Amaricoccus sp.]|uniref:hypothetical protein n=1 Tax=Amaricoccus sp. TaxID=1872485 RepID=UPI002B7F7A4D|nr:hypothetical protein [Amaricoccus sp.]HMQ93042.1 hypothetical protein [Amaricoccus sp.]HMR53330.1 hypothetical protein [Amaricoccus sp.]HMR59470.1 hypothetical protein [Amaricoccus sp.]HMT98963.1 hypothetical protein [Amaricoccus sp.]
MRSAGPGFFGIVTAYHVALKQAAKSITTVVCDYGAGAVAELSAWAEAAMATAPRNVEFTAKVVAGPAGPVIAAIATVFAFADAEARVVHDRLAENAPQALEVVGPLVMPFPALFGATDADVPAGRRYRVDSFWSESQLGPILAQVVADMVSAPSAETFAVISLRHNAAPIPTDAAMSCDGRIFGVVYRIWTEPDDDDASAAWLRATIEAITPFCSSAYVGLADLDRPGRRLPTHGPEAGLRLEVLRARFDPNGTFATPNFSAALAAERRQRRRRFAARRLPRHMDRDR